MINWNQLAFLPKLQEALQDVRDFTKGKYPINIKCIHCEAPESFMITTKQIEEYCNGGLMQNVFPEIAAGKREMLKSGYCSECWDKQFPSL